LAQDPTAQQSPAPKRYSTPDAVLTPFKRHFNAISTLNSRRRARSTRTALEKTGNSGDPMAQKPSTVALAAAVAGISADAAGVGCTGVDSMARCR